MTCFKITTINSLSSLKVFNGGLPKAAQLKVTFSEGGAIEFTNILRSLLERIGGKKKDGACVLLLTPLSPYLEANEIPKEYEALPAYEGSSSSSYPPPPPTNAAYPPPPSNTMYPPPPPPNSAPLNNYAGYPPPPSNGAYPPPTSTDAYPSSNAAYPPPPNPPPANYPPPNNDLPPNYVP